MVIEEMMKKEHEQVVHCYDRSVGLKAIIAIHDSTLGPALGGTRMWPYASEEEALRDVLRLSRGMTFKAAAAGLNLGGGKAVIIGDPKKDKSEALFRVYGQFINSLNGRYITAEDVGIDVIDMEFVFAETNYVVGIEPSHGGSGNPAPFTALGTFQGIRACLEKVYGDESMNGKVVVVQGVGQVGRNLIRSLTKAGAKVFATDIDREKLEKAQKEFNFEIVEPEAILDVDCDVFAPCALGGVINKDNLNKLKFKILAGAANNQLEEDSLASELKAKGILYAPDYVINAGGLINVYQELEGYSKTRAERMTRGIYYNLKNIFKLAEQNNVTNAKAAHQFVEQRLNQFRRSSSFFQQDRKTVLAHIHGRRTPAAV